MVNEFKNGADLGLNNYTYVSLTTYVDWIDGSAVLYQLAFCGTKTFTRSGGTSDYWTNWQELATKSDLTGSTNISIACEHELQEYLRYSIRGNIAIVDIGGIIMPYGNGQAGFYLPFMPKNRQVGIVHTDASTVVASTICYSMLDENVVRFHIPSECANKPLYGTLVFAL